MAASSASAASSSASTDRFVTDIQALKDADSSTKHLKYEAPSVLLGAVNTPQERPEIAQDQRQERAEIQWWLEQKRQLSQSRWNHDWMTAQDTLKHANYLFTNESVLLNSDVAAAMLYYIAQWSSHDHSTDMIGLRIAMERYKGCLVLKYILNDSSREEHLGSSTYNTLLAESDQSLGVYKKTLGRHRFLILQRRVYKDHQENADNNNDSVQCWSESTRPEIAAFDSLLALGDKEFADDARALRYVKRLDTLLHFLRKRTTSDDYMLTLDLLSNGKIFVNGNEESTSTGMAESLFPFFVDRAPAVKRNTSDTPAPTTVKRGKDVLARPTRWQDDVTNKVNLAIIVPYRDQKEQNRADQLDRFAEEMPKYIRTHCDSMRLQSFHIFVIEQSDDGYKFNRGKLLNIGYAIAFESGKDGDNGFNSFCLHDVDLLPGPELARYYSMRPERPIHIAAVWERYKNLRNYIGGILTLSDDIFRKTNGLPNNFWGWGGEDDELWDRLVETGHRDIIRPNIEEYGNSIADLEDKFIQEKGGIRAGQTLKKGGKSEFRNMRKHELRDQHERTWRKNGIKDLTYRILEKRLLNKDVTVYTVDLMGDDDPEAAKLSEEVKEYGQNFKKTRRMQ